MRSNACASAECGARSEERLRYAYASLTRIYLSAECGARNSALASAECGARSEERLRYAYASLTRKRTKFEFVLTIDEPLKNALV